MLAAEPNVILTVAEVAEYLRVDQDIIYRLVHDGDLRAVRIGRAIRIPMQEVRRYVEDQLASPGAP